MELCHGLTLGDPLEKLATDQSEDIFIDHYVFGTKNDKAGIDSKFQIFSYIIRPSVVSPNVVLTFD